MNSLPNNTHPNWAYDPGLRRLNFLLLASYLGAISNGYTSSLISSLIANPLWLHDIHGLSSTKRLGLLTSAHSLGCILAFFPAPYISDTYGRRAGMMLGNVVMICGFTGQVFCSTFEQFLGLRMLVGAASIVNTISSAALLVELAHPRQRGVAGALFNTCFFIGSSAAAWTAYGSMHLANAWSWKIPVAAQIGWSLASLCLTYFCPESPQWLIRRSIRPCGIQRHANRCAHTCPGVGMVKSILHTWKPATFTALHRHRRRDAMGRQRAFVALLTSRPAHRRRNKPAQPTRHQRGFADLQLGTRMPCRDIV
jgi:MFS family permease